MNHVRNILAALLIGATSVSTVFCADQVNQPGRIERLKNFASSTAVNTYNKGKELCTVQNAVSALLTVAVIYLKYKVGQLEAAQAGVSTTVTKLETAQTNLETAQTNSASVVGSLCTSVKNNTTAISALQSLANANSNNQD